MKILNTIKEKVLTSLTDMKGKTSSAIISSYFILGEILTIGLLYMIIDLVNAITQWKKGNLYSIPLEHIGIFSLILTHHLVLLGIKNNRDKSLFPNITKTIEEKHYTGVHVNTSQETANAEIEAYDQTESCEETNNMERNSMERNNCRCESDRYQNNR